MKIQIISNINLVGLVYNYFPS